MAIPDIFVVVTPMHSLEGGLTWGGAIRVKLEGGESAFLAFENAMAAENYRNFFGLKDAKVVLVSELARTSPSSLLLPDQALVFSSFEHLQSMQAHPETFDFSKPLVRLSLP